MSYRFLSLSLHLHLPLYFAVGFVLCESGKKGICECECARVWACTVYTADNNFHRHLILSVHFFSLNGFCTFLLLVSINIHLGFVLVLVFVRSSVIVRAMHVRENLLSARKCSLFIIHLLHSFTDWALETKTHKHLISMN